MTKQILPNRWFIWAIVAIVLTGFSVWGFVEYSNIKMENENAENLIISKPAKKVEIVDISDWKTYRNEKYGFEIKYPKDWSIKKDNINCLEGKEVAYDSCDLFFESYPYKIPSSEQTFISANPNILTKGMIVSLFIYNNPNKLTTDEYLLNEFRGGDLLNPRDFIEENINQNRFIEIGPLGNDWNNETQNFPAEYFIAKDNKFYDIRSYLYFPDEMFYGKDKNPMSLDERKSYESIFDQILSTFKFIK